MPFPMIKIIEIMRLILELILEGLSESEAIQQTSLQTGLSVDEVTNIWANHRK
ncbi:MAG: hypothetical protein NC177_05425 [Ruminococcus flavefaciens]|nr:hypothetical protein [Ruminococcus flavefaciens]